MKPRTIAASIAAAALAVTLTSAPAQAHRQPHPPNPPVSHVKTLASGLASPLKVAFGPHGSYLVAESFIGKLTRISASGKKSTMYSAPGHEIAGVSYRSGTTYFFDNEQGDNPEQPPTELLPALLKTIDQRGKVRTVADLSVFEKKYNPDRKTVYGVRKASKACLAQAPEFGNTAEVYSHPYSSTATRNGLYVGDAGANTILHVNKRGKVSLVKALPAEPIKITAAVAAAFAEMGAVVPNCMLGLTYYAQAVPTDVDVRGDWLYYTVLPGVPGEGLSTGKAYRMNLRSHHTQTLATGLSAPTGIAVSGTGGAYVSQLMGDGVVKLDRGRKITVLKAPMTGDVAISGKRMAVTTNVMADPPEGGSLVTAKIRW
ncbi:ScyD/ScyE family protein [Paeniglutamicibacter cryotolerans]|uniref:ScyD/ScyE family protein n=1 Tax=Paeniglutamicibacter cryotolerans TaxID=670079 RepID=A0A839QKL7_9MICC|nr:ScyD/ScyE family protein [Paeniglutamicibacter cryotolerans]MBB2996153.1 hypothetical protein [Paeniglutamicibacter cryotolerans]